MEESPFIKALVEALSFQSIEFLDEREFLEESWVLSYVWEFSWNEVGSFD